METDIYRVLKQYWGFDDFRPLQKDIILSILNQQDTLALLPTGGGKSVCFQVPAMVLEGICIVVSPLIALMKDQVEHLNQKGIKAATLHSGLSYHEADILLDNCVYGGIKFLYISPERLKNELFIERFKKMKVSLIAIDEAHCISQWGYDFRPSYLEIAQIRDFHPKVNIIALTATATTQVVEDIQEKLLFKNKNVLRKSFRRENLAYLSLKEPNKMQRLLSICQNIKGTGIIYVRNRRKTKEIAAFLQYKNISADYYHAGLDSKLRDKKQNDWQQDKTRIIVSTNAFGMGIDKPNVRFVVHLDIPESIEAYFQEAGRGGRDGKKAYAVLLWNDSDIEQLDKNFEISVPSIDFLKSVYAKVIAHLRLPFGSALNETYDFDIPLFCKKFNLDVLSAFNALKWLEKEGYFQLNEAIYNPSKLMVVVEKQELYRFQVATQQMDAFIKLVLRTYTGLFDNYAKIDEAFLAKRASTTKEQVIELLKRLKSNNIIDYKPASSEPSITFLREVADAKHLYIDVSRYKKLKEQKEKYIHSIKNYITNENECREVMLLEYFGESSQILCEKCDYCIEKKRKENEAKRQIELEDKILNLLKKQTFTTDKLMSEFKFTDEKQVKEILRRWLDNGKVRFNEDEKLFLNKD